MCYIVLQEISGRFRKQEVLYMITLHPNGVFLADGVPCDAAPISAEEGRRQTMAWNILQAHNTSGDPSRL